MHQDGAWNNTVRSCSGSFLRKSQVMGWPRARKTWGVLLQITRLSDFQMHLIKLAILGPTDAGPHPPSVEEFQSCRCLKKQVHGEVSISSQVFITQNVPTRVDQQENSITILQAKHLLRGKMLLILDEESSPKPHSLGYSALDCSRLGRWTLQ